MNVGHLTITMNVGHLTIMLAAEAFKYELVVAEVDSMQEDRKIIDADVSILCDSNATFLSTDSVNTYDTSVISRSYTDMHFVIGRNGATYLNSFAPTVDSDIPNESYTMEESNHVEASAHTIEREIETWGQMLETESRIISDRSLFSKHCFHDTSRSSNSDGFRDSREISIEDELELINVLKNSQMVVSDSHYAMYRSSPLVGSLNGAYENDNGIPFTDSNDGIWF